MSVQTVVNVTGEQASVIVFQVLQAQLAIEINAPMIAVVMASVKA
jgi:hypothetical protein